MATPLAEQVLLVAVYYRTNLTLRQLAPLFGVSPATVCRVIQKRGPLLALEPTRASQEAVERLWIVDGTLIPGRDRKVATSSRNYRYVDGPFSSAPMVQSPRTPIIAGRRAGRSARRRYVRGDHRR